MPGAVQATSPLLGPMPVMPYVLATAFQQSRTWEQLRNTFVNGEGIATLNVPNSSGGNATSRKKWAFTNKFIIHNVAMLPVNPLALLRNFFLARQGALLPFIFYDVFETVPLFTYDPSGAALDGQYVVRFDGDLNTTLQQGSSTGSLSLVEIA